MLDQLRLIAGTSSNQSNLQSFVAGLNSLGQSEGILEPHRFAQFLGQWAHESNGWIYDREIWGNTPAQKRYDTRTDLGNTPALDGDGYIYRGRTATQITGKANYGQFRDWCRARMTSVPDFVANPDAVNTDPWEGLGPIWYWSTRKLNNLADRFEFELITRAINGGLNGLSDRWRYYDRAALVLLGHGPTDVRKFQINAKLSADGMSGPKTRAALHAALKGLSK